MRIVGREGPEALSLRRLTQGAGTSTSAVYSLYGSRDALLDAVCRRAIEVFVESTSVAPTDNPLADLATLGRRYRRWALAHPKMYPVMFGRRRSDTPDSIRQRTGPIMAPLKETLQRCLDAGLLINVPVDTIVGLLWAMVHGYVTLEIDGLLAATLPEEPLSTTPEERFTTLLRAAISHWLA